MGVPGLWDVLRPAGRQRSLTDLAVTDGFEANPTGRRGLRVGIDASIWFYHAAYGKEGENPELRTLFFRCARLMGRPFLPLFVFDGPNRPSVKRGKRISGKDHWLTTGMQRIIESFGFEWRTAPGEAEAELAFLNRRGVIDAIISDDVDNFLFGAVMIIRNPSKNLSGNRAHTIKNSAGKEDEEHVYTYHASDLMKHEDVSLTVGGLILVGLLRGGDYHQEGLPGCGPNIAHGLARCGFGDTLVEAVHNLPREHMASFLANWRHEVRQELRTNSRGYLNSKKVKLAAALPETFPDIDILLSYTRPLTSESEGRAGRIAYTWNREPDLGRIAGICELYFEWGVKEVIVKRFRTVIWAPAVLRILRRAVLENDEEINGGSATAEPSTPRKKGKAPVQCGTPSSMIARHFSSLRLDSPLAKSCNSRIDEEEKEEEEEEPLIVKIHSKREHTSTDGILEYRLEIAPAQLVRLTEAGVKGVRPPIENGNDMDGSDEDGDVEEEDEDGKKKGKAKTKKLPLEPTSHLRVWMPACMVRIVEPELVKKFEDGEEKKRLKKVSAAEKKGKKGSSTDNVKKKDKVEQESEMEEDEREDFSDVFRLKKTSSSSSRTSQALRKKALNSKAPPVRAEEEEETEEEEPMPSRAAKGSLVTKGRSTSVPIAKITGKKASGTKPSLKKSHTSPVLVKSTLKQILEQDDSSPASTPRKPVRTMSVLGTIDISMTPSTTEPAQEASKPPPPRRAQPFPMTFSEDEEDLASDDGLGSSKQMQRLDKRSVRTRPRNMRSDSENSSRENVLLKSPRKSKDHASPRRNRILGAATRGNESQIENVRPSSPTPVPVQRRNSASDNRTQITNIAAKNLKSSIPAGILNNTKSKAQTTVIELSSDSDVPPTLKAPAVRPLLLAKARMNVQKIQGQAASSASRTTKTTSLSWTETVIDLT